MELKNGIKTFYARTRKEWRKWLGKNCGSEKSVGLIVYHKKSATPSVYYNEAIEEAICFGWIDSKADKRDADSSYLFFTQRNPKSHWSQVNKERAADMIKQGLMSPSGQAFIDLAKKTGTWKALVDGGEAVIPDDLQKLFNKNKKAFKNFQEFPPSSKRLFLEWILNAKKPETRKQRLLKTVELASKGIKSY